MPLVVVHCHDGIVLTRTERYEDGVAWNGPDHVKPCGNG
jgi:hypothetical protein